VNPLDLGVLAIIAVSAVFAFARGVVREALSIVAWVGAVLVALYGFNPVYAIVVPLVTTPLLADLVAGLGLFLVALVILVAVTSSIARRVQRSALSPIDRTLGFIFGLVRGAVIVSLAWLVLDVAVPMNERPLWIRDAKSAPYLAQGADMLSHVLPPSLRQTAVIDTDSNADQASDAARAMGALANPATPLPPPLPTPNYDQSDRHDLDRLIQGQQR
jgi:membrane protein required for colicin V production